MRIPLHPAGRREMTIITILCLLPAIICLLFAPTESVWPWIAAGVLVLVWAGLMAFFRDPQRDIPAESGIMVAPADGKVVEITHLDHHPDIGGPATKIGIFLSVLDVHVNRAPCVGTVELLRYEPGGFLDARNPESSTKNEANTIVMDTGEDIGGPVVVRQIAGKIARRIVCSLKVGDKIGTGQRIGLIKFGSRTELILPGHDQFVLAVEIGQKVYGAATIMARRAVAPAGEMQEQQTETAAGV
jgi:phosphatidylserine decarboxylase